MTYDQIVQGLRDATYELQNEGRRVAAGLKTEQDTASIVERYAWLYSDEALDAVGEPADEGRRRGRRAGPTGRAGRGRGPRPGPAAALSPPPPGVGGPRAARPSHA